MKRFGYSCMFAIGLTSLITSKAYSEQNFAGHYFPLSKCNTVVTENITFSQVNLSADSQVKLDKIGVVVTSFSTSNYSRGALRFAIYDNQTVDGQNAPRNLIADTYDLKYNAAGELLSAPYRFEAAPRQNITLNPGVYWIAMVSNVYGAGNLNIGCKVGNARSSAYLSHNPTSPFFPETLDSFHPFSIGFSTNENNLFFLYSHL
ncbi:MAG: hypothetical protein NT027_12340 [Proteobacteria bacterium]|nr:hypothetical protein [Pseudomonadota bacterium]